MCVVFYLIMKLHFFCLVPGMKLLDAAVWLNEVPESRCLAPLRLSYPDYKEYHFPGRRISVVVDWNGRIVQIQQR